MTMEQPSDKTYIPDRMLLDMDWMLQERAIEDAEFFGPGRVTVAGDQDV